MWYENKYDLMDKETFPKDSIFLAKENPKKAITKTVPRVFKTDEEIIASVSDYMANTLGADLES